MRMLKERTYQQVHPVQLVQTRSHRRGWDTQRTGSLSAASCVSVSNEEDRKETSSTVSVTDSVAQLAEYLSKTHKALGLIPRVSRVEHSDTCLQP